MRNCILGLTLAAMAALAPCPAAIAQTAKTAKTTKRRKQSLEAGRVLSVISEGSSIQDLRAVDLRWRIRADLDRSGVFAMNNDSVYSVGIDLKSSKGVAIARQLAALMAACTARGVLEA